MATVVFVIDTYELHYRAVPGDETPASLTLKDSAGEKSCDVYLWRDDALQDVSVDVYPDELDESRVDIHMRISKLAEWLDTLREERPVWLWATEASGTSPAWAQILTGPEPTGEHEPSFPTP
jgi:hypothetical protein